MKFKGMKQAGFSLVELMVVVGIIGILAAIAVPKLQRFTAKAKQSEPRTNLRTIDTLQQAYFAENGSYNTSSTVGADTVKWKFYVASGYPTAATNVFTISATASGKLCPGNTNTDTWTIDHNSNLSNTTDATSGC